MNEYVLYTFEGFTQSPSGKDCENIHLLGFECGKDVEDAIKMLAETEKWIEELDFDVEEIKGKQLLTKGNKEDIKTLIDYLWTDEEKNFEECGFPQDHIYQTLKKLKELIE